MKGLLFNVSLFVLMLCNWAINDALCAHFQATVSIV